ncbi:MAG: O-antigen ligase family protein [Nitrospiraceae bacterium]|nr:O-antigen ligase family protein [Nitrospiraceae bacterium]
MYESGIKPIGSFALPDQKAAGIRNTSLDAWVFFFFALPLFMSPLSTSGAAISKVLFAAVWLAGGYWRNLKKTLSRPWFWPVVAILAINLLGMLWTRDTARGLNVLSRLNCFLIAMAGAALPWDRSRFKLVVRLFLAGLFLNAMAGGLQWFHLDSWLPANTEINADTGPTGFANHIFLSMALANALLWLAYDIKHKVVLPRPVNAILALLFFTQLIITGGRAGQVAFILLFPLALWMLYPGRWRRLAMAAAVLSIIGLSLSPMVQGRIREGMSDLSQYRTGNVDTSMGFRFVFWEGALKLAKEHPFAGVGTGDYELAMAGLQRTHAIPNTMGLTIDHPHNTYLAYLADLGLPGFLILMWFLWVVTKESWDSRRRPEAWFRLCYMGIFILGSFTDTLIWGFDNTLALGLIMALPAVISDSDQSRRSPG